MARATDYDTTTKLRLVRGATVRAAIATGGFVGGFVATLFLLVAAPTMVPPISAISSVEAAPSCEARR